MTQNLPANFYVSITGLKPKNFWSTFGYESDRIPAWDEVHDLWLKNGKEY